MGGLLYQLIAQKSAERKLVPKDILIETKIAKRVSSDLPAVNALGVQVPFNCPGCGGVLWKVDKGSSMRTVAIPDMPIYISVFTCRTNHED